MTVTTDQYLKTIARELGRIAHALEAIAKFYFTAKLYASPLRGLHSGACAF